MSRLTNRSSRTALAGAAIVAALALPVIGASAASAGDAFFAPIANDDEYSMVQGTSMFIGGTGIVTNDTNSDSGDLHINTMFPDVAGEVTGLIVSGSFSFTPDPAFVGDRFITYTVIDTLSGFTSNVATVTIHVTAAQHKLAGSPDFYTTTMDTPFSTGDHDQLIANDVDSTYVGGIDDATGEVVVSIYGELSYTPAPGFIGTKTFSYWLDDSTNIPSDLILVTIEVTGGAISTIPSDPGTPGGGSDLPTLAYTGSDDVTAWLLAPALALLGVGVGVVWFARRRAAR